MDDGSVELTQKSKDEKNKTIKPNNNTINKLSKNSNTNNQDVKKESNNLKTPKKDSAESNKLYKKEIMILVLILLAAIGIFIKILYN